jgi:hypothetical protein
LQEIKKLQAIIPKLIKAQKEDAKKKGRNKSPVVATEVRAQLSQLLIPSSDQPSVEESHIDVGKSDHLKTMALPGARLTEDFSLPQIKPTPE